MIKYLRIDEKSHNTLCYYRDLKGLSNFKKLFQSIKFDINCDDIRNALNYVKSHRKSDALVARVTNILKWLNGELDKDVHNDYKEELLSLKIFCEEYLK